MKRFVLVTILVAALAVAAKLALKPNRSSAPARWSGETSSFEDIVRSVDPSLRPSGDDDELLARFPKDRELIERLLETFGHNARRIAVSEGLSGLRLLDNLEDAAVCLYEDQPDEFHRLSQAIGMGAESAKLISAWGRYFDPRQADRNATAVLAAELGKLSPRVRRLAAETPEALPFLLSEPRRMANILERLGPRALEPLAFIDLSESGESLRRALRLLERQDKLALAAFEELGPAGFLLVERFGGLIAQIEPELGLRDSLLVAAAALDDFDDLLKTRRTATLAQLILHLQSRGLLASAAGVRYGVSLAAEFGDDGERALEVAGPHAADVVYRLYPEGHLRNSVAQAIARGGVSAAIASEKYASSLEFRRVVQRDGAPAILAVASACTAEESQAFLAAKPKRTWSEGLALLALRLSGDTPDKTIRAIERDGIQRVQQLADTQIEFYQLLPLYDLSHLSGVVVKGQMPTRGEFVWAGLDAGLVAFDALSLLALQPEGAAAGEAARSGIKSAARTTAKETTQAVVEKTAETVAGQAARAAADELARGAGRQMEREAVASGERLAEAASVELARSLARRTGIRLGDWNFLSATRTGVEVLRGLPRNRIGKYVVANVAQATVGIVAVRKMEEYMASRNGPGTHPLGSTTGSKDSAHEDQ